MAEGFSNPIVAAGVTGLHDLYATRAVTPVEAVEVYLARIARLNPALGAVTDLDISGAHAAAHASAARWTANAPLSHVDGAPILVKSNIAVARLPWTAGIGAYRNRIAAVDAEVVARLRRAGAVILGCVNMHEGALGATTDNPWFGRTENPHRAGLTPGGSSGGSGAAAAAGLCAAALGTDTMGSVRIPSAYCGIFGHKPTRGRIPTAGVTELSWTLDHVGPHARSADDCAAILNAVAPARQARASARPLAVLEFEGQVEVEPEVRAALDAVFDHGRRQGLSFESLRLSDYDFGRMRRLGLLISEAEGYVVHEAAITADPEGFSDQFRPLLQWGATQPAHRLARAYRDLSAAAQTLSEAFAPYAGVLMPTAPQVAFPFGPAPANQADFTAIADFTGQPATAFPAGVTADGLPLSCQIVAADDAHALALARKLSRPTPPPLLYRG